MAEHSEEKTVGELGKEAARSSPEYREETLEELNKASTQVSPNFKEEIEADSHKDGYLISKAFKNGVKKIAPLAVYLIAAFIFYSMGLIAWLLFELAVDIKNDPKRISEFMSNVWSFIGGILAAISVTYIKKARFNR